ncbi:hypothetical protein [Fodinibius roseus]|nr:hypothetical protein [Fodinibius roseus]
MIKPTEQILSICEEANIKTTIFFEVVEYLRLKEEWNKGNNMGYERNPIEAIDQQIHQAVKKGHDIQLHIHPQWVNAKYINDKWQVDLLNWRLGDFKTNRNYSIKDLLEDGKSTLENIVQKVKPEYECIALRAGAYNIMPSKKVLAAMTKIGLKLDSSVYPGGYEDGELSKYDYRNISLEKDFWWADPDNILQEAKSLGRIMEIPIFALEQPRWKKILNFEKLKSLLIKRGAAVSSVAKTKLSSKSLFEKIAFLFETEAFTWDFCLFNKSMHKTFFNYIEENLQDKRDTFVILGHPKSFTTEHSLRSLIEIAQKSNCSYSFKTLQEVYAEFSK